MSIHRNPAVALGFGSRFADPWGLTLPIRCLLVLFGAGFFGGTSLRAQVSPGPLSRPHHSLDTPLKCASCHTFGAGREKLKCMNCHGEILALVRAHESMHGRVVDRAKGDNDCARCHSEHNGENFRIFKWDTSEDEFDHRQTGYVLEGRHARLKCRACHNSKHISVADHKRIMVRDLDRTFEGMHPACLTCHEDPHTGQLGADCQKCHDVFGWKPVKSFDHSNTRFPLTGKHQAVECAKCHKPTAADPKIVQYRGLDFATCTGCHQDPHHGAFEGRRCEACHNTNTWKGVQVSQNNFDHSKTKFPLNGKHTELACQVCHKASNFKEPIAHEKCMDCHQDPHNGQFKRRPDRGECGSCHQEAGWKPSTFTETSHQSSAYPLVGKHQGVACAKCHPGTGLGAKVHPVTILDAKVHSVTVVDTNYYPAFKACLDCHKDPHGKQFASDPHANKCEDCHKVEGFEPSSFTLSQHQSITFALNGAHTAVACQDCHRKETAPPGADRQYHFANRSCDGCHQDPHHGEYPDLLKARLKRGQELCESCHSVRSWREVKPFDHDITKWPLTGLHRALGCLDCHRPAATEASAREIPVKAATERSAREIPFKAAPEKCVGCHEDIHNGQFQRIGEPVECGTCHDTGAHWSAGKFDHDSGTSFSLAGAHEQVPCQRCHTERKEINGRTVVTYHGTPRECSACHR